MWQSAAGCAAGGVFAAALMWFGWAIVADRHGWRTRSAAKYAGYQLGAARSDQPTNLGRSFDAASRTLVRIGVMSCGFGVLLGVSLVVQVVLSLLD